MIKQLTVKDQEKCAADGSVQVDVVDLGTASGLPADDFDFKWFSGSLSNPLDPATDKGNNVLDNTDVILSPTGFVMGAGTYFVSVVRKFNSTGGQIVSQDCESAPLRADVRDLRVDPVVVLTSTANTSCDGQFDGKITAIVTTTGFPDDTDYDFKWTAPSPSVFDASGVFTGKKAPAIAPLVFASSATQKLGEGQYKVEVTNTVNLCKSDAFVSLETKAVPPELVIVSSADQLTCTPDGSVTVERIDFQNLTNADHNGFDFQFFKGNASGTPVAQTAADPLFTNPRVMTPFSNLGEGTYFVKVTRGTGILPGSGCTSAPYRADITDRSANPEVTLVSQANTACDPLNADGKITVTATTRLYDQVTRAYAPYPATTEYDFEWMQKPAGTTFVLPIPAAPSPAVFASSATQKLSDGNYELKLTNRDNKCFS
ncbi:MAG: hypothetical protein ACKOYP_01030, partial [Bacteroidota bacterium]